MKQKQAIREWLESGRSLTPLLALDLFGSMRLGARIFDLREEGMPIEKEMICDPTTGKHFARYTLGVAK